MTDEQHTRSMSKFGPPSEVTSRNWNLFPVCVSVAEKCETVQRLSPAQLRLCASNRIRVFSVKQHHSQCLQLLPSIGSMIGMVGPIIMNRQATSPLQAQHAGGVRPSDSNWIQYYFVRVMPYSSASVGSPPRSIAMRRLPCHAGASSWSKKNFSSYDRTLKRCNW